MRAPFRLHGAPATQVSLTRHEVQASIGRVQFDDLTPAQRAAKVLFASTSAPFLRAFAQRQGPRDLVQVRGEA